MFLTQRGISGRKGGLIVLALMLTGCDSVALFDSSSGAIKACEAKLIKSLVAPSTYRRVSAEFYETDFKFEDFYQSEGGDACRPFDDGDCDDLKKFYRATFVKWWLLGDKSLTDEDAIQKDFRRVDDLPFPKVSTAKKWKADREYFEDIYKRRYQSGPKPKLPAALVRIEYDSANSYNAQLRGQYACSFKPSDNDRYSDYGIY